jgi:heme exporter protein D
MKYATYLWGAVILSLVLVIVLLFRVVSLDSQVRSLAGASGDAVQESLERVQADLATAKETAPGLGEYMSTIQLHAGKLWLPLRPRIGNWQNTRWMS